MSRGRRRQTQTLQQPRYDIQTRGQKSRTEEECDALPQGRLVYAL